MGPAELKRHLKELITDNGKDNLSDLEQNYAFGAINFTAYLNSINSLYLQEFCQQSGANYTKAHTSSGQHR